MLVESIIVQKIKEGNRESLALLWQRYSKNVLNLAYRMMKDRDQAEDILMDVFALVPKAIQNFRGESSLGTWLYRLTANASLMKLRAQKRHRELEDDHLEDIEELALGSKFAECNNSYNPQLLEAALSKLNAQTRSMLWLKDAEGLDIKDIAEIFDMPEGTVKARLSRARNFVKNIITETEERNFKGIELCTIN